MKLHFNTIRRFVKIKSLGSIIIFVASISAIIMANSSLSSVYNNLLDLEFTIGFSDFHLSKSVLHWINDGFMTIFFFYIGLEIKREFLIGELNTIKKAILPVFAAIGGMIIPISLFLLLNYGREGTEGWGIPMATDIAYSLGVLGLFGKRIPFGLKIFLTTYAIIDDLGAVIVIAVFYSSLVYWHLILIAFSLLLILFMLSIKNLYSKYVFIIVGIIVWVLFLESGIHPTIAGVLFAFTIPSHRKKNFFKVFQKANKTLNKLSQLIGTKEFAFYNPNDEINTFSKFTSEIQSPLQQYQNKLHGIVSFLVIPAFAFTNAGICLVGDGSSITRLSLNIALSLFVGKVIGISLFSYLSIKLKIAVLPLNVSFKQIVGLGFLGGLGFTMSVFISNLSYQSVDLINSAKVGILFSSVVASVIGFLVIRNSLKKKSTTALNVNTADDNKEYEMV